MKKTLFVIITLLLMSSILFAGSRRDSGSMTIRQGVLTIGIEIGYPPMEYYGPDGVTPMGFDIEMGKAIAEKLGLRAEFVDTAWDGIFAGVETGRYDVIISSVTITPARLVTHNFSKPYLANSLAMVVMRGSSVTARSPYECTGLDIAFQADTTSDFFMQNLANETGLRYNPRRYEKVMSCFDELRLGRVDAIITDLIVANDYIAWTNNPYEVVWISPEPEIFGICIKNGNDALTDAINKALEELFDDGTMQRISMRFFDMDFVTAARQLW